MIRLNSVVLPAPFGPMIRRRSPGITVSETSRVAGRPPKRLLRPVTSSAGRGHAAGSDAALLAGGLRQFWMRCHNCLQPGTMP